MPITTPPSASQEIRLDLISESSNGAPISIGLDYTTVNDVTSLHEMTQGDVIDRVTLTLWNKSASKAIVVSVIVNPTDTASGSAVDAATVKVSVPANSSVTLPPLFVRHASTSYSIAAYVATADVDNVLVTGYYSRLAQGSVTA